MEEYLPPGPGMPFANLNMTCLEKRPLGDIADEMERELERWLKLYPMPLMVSSFDERGNLINLEAVRPESHVIGLRIVESDALTIHWRLLENEEFPNPVPTNRYLQSIYADVPCKTNEELRANALGKARKQRLGWWVVFFWMAVIPGVVAIMEFFSPVWIAVIVLVYCLAKALEKALKLLGVIKQSEKEMVKNEEAQRIQHHHYHCEENPEGFLSLKLENYERWAQEEVRAEVETLRKNAEAQNNG